MSLSNEEMQEFKIEANDLLAEAESSLLKVERGEDFNKNYDSIFRAFHSLKGAAGMLDLSELQNHMHKIENLFQQLKDRPTIGPNVATFFLKSIDAARSLLEFEPITFDYNIPTNPPNPATPQKPADSNVTKILTRPEIETPPEIMILVTKLEDEESRRIIEEIKRISPRIKIGSADLANQSEIHELLERAFELLLFKFSDLDEYLNQKGKKDIASIMRRELHGLIESKKRLRQPS